MYDTIELWVCDRRAHARMHTKFSYAFIEMYCFMAFIQKQWWAFDCLRMLKTVLSLDTQLSIYSLPLMRWSAFLSIRHNHTLTLISEVPVLQLNHEFYKVDYKFTYFNFMHLYCICKVLLHPFTDDINIARTEVSTTKPPVTRFSWATTTSFA